VRPLPAIPSFPPTPTEYRARHTDSLNSTIDRSFLQDVWVCVQGPCTLRGKDGQLPEPGLQRRLPCASAAQEIARPEENAIDSGRVAAGSCRVFKCR